MQRRPVRDQEDVQGDQSVTQPLVITFEMIVRDELGSRFSNRCFAEQDHPFKTRLFDAPHESFSVSIQIRASRRDPNRRHARFGECVQELGREQRIAIVDQIAFPFQAGRL